MADRTVTTDLIGRDRMSGAYDSAGRSAERSGGRMQKFGELLKGPLAGGAAAGVAALVGLGKAAIDNASNAEQSIGATETVFGKFADQVISKSKDERDSVRLTAHEYREAANLIGAGFKNQGVAADELAGKTSGMIQIGADLAATYGGSTKEAVEALGSAFKGEYDPMERYGIGLSAAKVQGELVRMGSDKLTGSQLALATQQATTNLIMKQAGGALGAAGRESKTTAAQTEALQEKYGNLSADLGAKLLPVVNKVLSAGIALMNWATKHKTATQAVAVAVGVLSVGILALNLAMLANPAGLMVVGIALLAAGFVALWKKSNTFRTVMIGVFKAVSNVVLGAISAYLRAFEGLFSVLGRLPGKAGRAFRSAAGTARSARQQVDGLRNSINKVKSKHVTVRVGTIFYQKGKEPGTYGNGLGVVAPGRALGGPVQKGRPYVVGERRAELFVPDQSGTIIPDLSKMSRRSGGGGGGGGDTYVTIRIDRPLGTPAQIRAAVVEAFERSPAGARRLPAGSVAR